MRILYTAVDTPVPGGHGGSIHALELCRALGRRDHEVHLVAPSGDGTVDPGVQHHAVPRPVRFFEWSHVGRVQQIAERVRPDVVVERFYTFGGAGIWAARRLGLPAVLEVNSPARAYPGSWRDRLDRLSLVQPVDRWRRCILAWSDAIYATSVHLLPPACQPAVTVVTNGVDTSRFRPGRVATGEPLRCVYASSFRAWHGAEHLVAAVRLAVQRGADLRVTCLGDGPTRATAQRAADRAGLTGVVDFVGRVPYPEVPAYHARADVGLAPFDPAAFPALQLGWFWSPIKVFEYLAAGLLVVTIGNDELRQLLPETVAVFYDPGDVPGLAGVLTRLAADPTRARAARDASRRLAESRYSWDQQAMTVERVLGSVVPGGRVTSIA